MLLGHVAALLAVLLIAGLFLRSTHQLSQMSHRVARTLDVIHEVDHLLSLIKDAETSKRGFLLLGEDRYLKPYDEARRALGPTLERLHTLIGEDAPQQERLERMEALLRRKLQVMEHNLELARSGQRDAALEDMRTGEGQQLMDELRGLEQRFDAEEQQRLEEQNLALGRAARGADVLVLTGSLFLLSFIGFASWSARRDAREQEHQHAEREALLAREQLEGARRGSEERFQLIAETLPQLIWRTRADGYTEYFNPRWSEYSGQAPEQARGDSWIPFLHPEDVERTLKAWRHSLATGEPYCAEYRLRRGSDGSYRWFIARGLALRGPGGDITHWFGTSTDIDDQKRGAESLRFLSEAGAALASSLDLSATLQQVARLAVPGLADWCIVDVVGRDGQMERVGVAHADPSLAEIAELLRRYAPHPGHPSALAMSSDKTVYLAELSRDYEEQVTRNAEHLEAARKLKIRSVVSVPLLARGRTLGVMMFVHTQTSGRRYEPEDIPRLETVAYRAALAIDNARLFSLAQEERQRAEEANRLKDDFLSTVSHELRTPLTAMIGWLNLLRGGRLPAHKHAKALETVDRNAQAQAQLIEDLLDVSRIMSGKLRLDMQPLHLGDIVQAALESVRPAADAKGIHLEAPLEPSELRVQGDAGRLQQVVWNLLSNAVKFSPGGRHVRVRLGSQEGLARLTVEDEGPGIPADFLPHIFERFRQLEGGTNRRHGGLGLGLAIVRHLVELHGGTVHATSEGLGHGAVFTVLLPFAQSRPAPPEPASPRRASPLSPPPRATASRLAGRHLLVVDDEPDSREVMKLLLEDTGARVTTAADAAEAFQLLRELRPELLVSDVGMPGEDGHSLIARVRALPAEEGGRIPAVALTAYARVEDRARALAAGFDLHVAKPVEPAELTSLLTQLLSGNGEALE